jgi:hypothetical protein
VNQSDEAQETLGALLARLRGDQGISQLRLAERLCAASGQPTVTRHEICGCGRGERIPTGYWLGWLGAVLDAPLTELERAAAVARAHRRRPPAATVAVGSSSPSGPWVRLWPGVYRRAS